jgi:hypothetical protein
VPYDYGGHRPPEGVWVAPYVGPQPVRMGAVMAIGHSEDHRIDKPVDVDCRRLSWRLPLGSQHHLLAAL